MFTRKVGQRIVINKNIIIEIASVNYGTVRVAIKAPHEVPVDREEVHKMKMSLVEEKKP